MGSIIIYDALKYVTNRIGRKGLLNTLSGVMRKLFPRARPKMLVHMAHAYWKLKRNKSLDCRLIQIETLAGCNYRCGFCPIGQIDMPMGRMTKETFENIIKQLKYFEGELDLFFRNEPLLDKRIFEFVKYAKENTRANIVLQTNGSLLTKEKLDILTSSCTVIVNDYTDSGEIADRIRSWRKMEGVIISARSSNEVLTNRAGNLPESENGHFQGFCAKPFAEMTIAFNGDVVLCCQDWMLEEKFGNTNENTLEEIWTNKLFANKRQLLRDGQRDGLCRKCDFIGV